MSQWRFLCLHSRRNGKKDSSRKPHISGVANVPSRCNTGIGLLGAACNHPKFAAICCLEKHECARIFVLERVRLDDTGQIPWGAL